MTRHKFAVCLAGALVAIATNAAAHGPWPFFLQLQSEINANRGLVTANQDLIEELNAELDALRSRIEAIEGNLDDLSVWARDNEIGIAEIFRWFGDAEGDIEIVYQELSDVTNLYRRDVAAARQALQDLKARTGLVVADVAALARRFGLEMATLRGAVTGGSVGIDALVTDVAILAAELSIQSSLSRHLWYRQETLQTEFNLNSADLDILEASLEDLKVMVFVRQDSCIEQIAIGQSSVGYIGFGGECEAVHKDDGNHDERYYRLQVYNPSTITIDMFGSACGGPWELQDPYLYLRNRADRHGSVVALNDDAGCGLNAQLVTHLQPGVYTIVATTFSNSGRGSFELTVR